MKIAIAQMNSVVGDFAGNAAKIAEYCDRARYEGAALVVTPELALAGYSPEDLLLRRGFLAASDAALMELTQKVRGVTLVVGHPTREGDRCFNSASVICDGEIIASYHKHHLPNYTVFDEERYFASGEEPCVFESAGTRIGINICADIWWQTAASRAADAGAEILLVLNASPYHTDKQQTRIDAVRDRIKETGMSAVYANLVGGQDELVFDGASFAIDASGRVVVQAKEFEQALVLVEFKGKKLQSGKVESLLPPEAAVYRALCLGVKDYVEKNNFPGVLLGLSGGVDSALTVAIAVDALGANRVRALMMPSQYTAQISLEDARAIATNLGVRYTEFPIAPIYESFLSTFKDEFKDLPRDTTEENLQSRIRGTILMALSNKFGSIVLTTGNKSEMSVGYATLYGDMAGGFAVLKDISKTLVYRLVEYRNSVSEVIPRRVITRAPSAELKADQTDQDSLPPYDVLDAIMEAYVERDMSVNEIVAAGYRKEDVLKVAKLIKISEYKRRQAPIGIRVTPRGFGKDWRYPVTYRSSPEF
jgi:NAD+ synthetase